MLKDLILKHRLKTFEKREKFYYIFQCSTCGFKGLSNSLIIEETGYHPDFGLETTTFCPRCFTEVCEEWGNIYGMKKPLKLRVKWFLRFLKRLKNEKKSSCF